ncbi:MAG TPA: hypothetical protein VK756_00725 [Solirubrobacteraceae bacterium]|jgi:glucose-1-phosphate thymidylyltransferase|nr:hypothetical protein [Solirubrobacteraceae bacterium]
MVFKGLIVPAADSFSDVEGAGTALARVANRPLVCHVLEALRQAQVTQIAVLAPAAHVAWLRAYIAAEGPAGLDVEYVPYEHGAFERALASVVRFVADSPCVVHAASGLLTQPLAPLLAAVAERDLLALVHRRPATDGSIALAARRMLRLTGAREEDRALELAGSCSLELAGASLFGAGALREAIGLRAWRCEELDLVAVAEGLVDRGARVAVQRVGGWRSNTGDSADLLECNRVAFDTLAHDPGGSGSGSSSSAARNPEGADNRIEGYVDAHPTACVRASVIVGPATLGPGAQVVDSYIGPYTSIGADVHIEGVEIERSIVLPGASIMHIGGRLTGSVVGRDARVFRDFSLPRALRLNVGDGGEVALC